MVFGETTVLFGQQDQITSLGNALTYVPPAIIHLLFSTQGCAARVEVIDCSICSPHRLMRTRCCPLRRSPTSSKFVEVRAVAEGRIGVVPHA